MRDVRVIERPVPAIVTRPPGTIQPDGLPTVERMAQAVPRHRNCSEDATGHDGCLWEARRILANLRETA